MIDWTTAAGTRITMEIQTSEELVIDHTISRPCWHLATNVYTAAGKHELFWGASVVDHPKFGRVLKVSDKTYISLPAAHMTEIEALMAEYAAGVAERRAAEHAEIIESERQARQHARLVAMAALSDEEI